MKFNKGFTLIEIMIVVGIIGILSSVVFSSLGNARAKARTAAAQQTMGSIFTGLVSCWGEGNVVNTPAVGDLQDGGAGAICAGSGTSYVILPPGWVYCDDDPGGTCATVSTPTSISAFGDAFTVTCTDTGCVTI
jgi:prepilin-type N-terminal cleavage/methylation domain-containing protein